MGGDVVVEGEVIYVCMYLLFLRIERVEGVSYDWHVYICHWHVYIFNETMIISYVCNSSDF